MASVVIVLSLMAFVAVLGLLTAGTATALLMIMGDRRTIDDFLGVPIFARFRRAFGSVVAPSTDAAPQAAREPPRREELLQEVRFALGAMTTALVELDTLVDELESDVEQRARTRAELDAAIASRREIAEITQAQADALAEDVLRKLAPRDRRSFWATFWVTAGFGTLFFAAGVTVTHLFG